MSYTVETLTVGPVETNCYLIGAENEVIVIDPGAESDAILKACAGRRIAAILLTHGHFDHIGAVDALMQAHPSARLMIHSLDLPMLRDPVQNAGAGFGLPTIVQASAACFADGDSLAFGELVFQVVHTPGHTPGSSCFVLNHDLFSGDTLFFGGDYGRTDLPGGDLRQMLASLRRLQPIAAAARLHPGHGGA